MIYYFRRPVKSQQPIDIAATERNYNCRYMGDFSVPVKQENDTVRWSEQPVAVFHCANKVKPEHATYMGIFRDPMTGFLTICDAQGAFHENIRCFIHASQVVFSAYRHDFQMADGELSRGFIDGGRDYLRLGGPVGELYNLSVDDGHFVVTNDDGRYIGRAVDEAFFDEHEKLVAE